MNFQRAGSTIRFLLLLLCIALLLSAAVLGVYFSDDTQLKGIFEDGAIRLGLDLAGGSVVTYEAVTGDSGNKLDAGMESIERVMRTRLDDQGFTEALVYRAGDKRVTIEIPSVTDPGEVIENIMKTAVLKFVDSEGKTVLTGDMIEEAYPQFDEKNTSTYAVGLKMTDKGAGVFADMTKKAAADGTSFKIMLDDEVISTVGVDKKYASTGITGGMASISSEGNPFTYEYAKQLADYINAGALAYELSVAQERTVGATLGEKSLSTSLIAGGIGLLLVMVFMCLYYRIPGVMASIALVAYTAIFMLVLSITQANLTLTGIAGIILSIGMAVDANVVIFERLKEEVAKGKSVKAAIKGGFHRAFAAILDANVTTVIACGVLYFLGSGTIKGFAVTLFYGVLISLFTALVITRALLYLGVGMGITSTRLYSSRKEGAENA